MPVQPLGEHRNKGSRECTFCKQAAKNVGNDERLKPRIGHSIRAEHARKDHFPRHPSDPAEHGQPANCPDIFKQAHASTALTPFTLSLSKGERGVGRTHSRFDRLSMSGRSDTN